MTQVAVFARALEKTEGIGWSTITRLIRAFHSYESLLQYPREQILLRIRRTRNASAIVQSLFDPLMAKRIEEANSELEALTEKGIAVLAPRCAERLSQLGDLPAAFQPPLLYAYGKLDVGQKASTAVFAEEPSPEPPLTLPHFNTILALNSINWATQTGTTIVLPMGLSRAPSTVRPKLREVVQAGGTLVSPFSMNHGPYSHDRRIGIMVMAALADECIFLDPAQGSSEWTALQWAVQTGRSVYANTAESLPLPVHGLNSYSPRNSRTSSSA